MGSVEGPIDPVNIQMSKRSLIFRSAVTTLGAGLVFLGSWTACSGKSDKADNNAKGSGGEPTSETENFSFFVTSYAALQRLSGNQEGFGGDLRFGETGPGAGLRGADKICATIAEASLPGAGAKQWRAFLSASDDGSGHPVNAIDRIGSGPWYDRVGRVFGTSIAKIAQTRPADADPAIKDDFPNEDGIPNHQPDLTQDPVDNHDMLTGSDATGKFYDPTATCLDWTSALGDIELEGKPRVGHSWPRNGGSLGGGLMLPGGGTGGFGPIGGAFGFPGGGPPSFGGDFGFPGGETFGGAPPGLPGGPLGFGGDAGSLDAADIGDVDNWMSSLTESGCAPGVNLLETGGPSATKVTVGSGGGYGGFYCFALTP
jgi:hypothetical protein